MTKIACKNVDYEKSASVLDIDRRLENVSDRTILGTSVIQWLKDKKPLPELLKQIQESARDNRKMVSDVIGEQLLNDILNLELRW